MFCLYSGAPCACSAQGDQKKTLDFLELELQIV